MEYVRNRYGICTEFVWSMCGICKELERIMYEIGMEYV
jgi:hypothetical protein